MWMERTVGGNQSIGTEIGVVDNAHKSHITTVCPVLMSFVICLGKHLIHPVPDKATLQLVVFINQVPIILEVTLTITHGMGILTENQRTSITLIDMTTQRPNTSIHRTIYIRLGIIATTLILYRTCLVHRLSHIIEFLEVWSISTFVSHRPDYNRGIVAVSLDHAIHTVMESRIPIFLVCQFLVFSLQDTMAFYVGFTHHIQSIFIAELIPF